MSKQFGFRINLSLAIVLMCRLTLVKVHKITSMPLSKYWNSGHINAFPAYAASIWSHTFSLAHTSPNSDILSNEQQPVVPSVAHTYNIRIRTMALPERL